MADERLRALARQAAQGDAEAHARWLLGRLRAGELSSARLRLAAALGHPPARAALAGQAPPPLGGLDAWEEDMQDWEHELLVQAALAAGRRGLAVWEARHPDDARLAEALATAEDWVATGSDAGAVRAATRALTVMEGELAADWMVYAPPNGAALEELVDEALAPAEESEQEAAEPERRARAGGRAVKEAVWCVAWRAEGASRRSLSNYAWKAVWELRWASAGPAEAEAALREELIAWAVGAPT